MPALTLTSRDIDRRLYRSIASVIFLDDPLGPKRLTNEGLSLTR